MLAQAGRDACFGRGDEQSLLPGEIRKEVGDHVAEHLRVFQDARAVTGDGRVQCLVRFAPFIKWRLRLTHVLFLSMC
jgi:hypothetical protein